MSANAPHIAASTQSGTQWAVFARCRPRPMQLATQALTVVDLARRTPDDGRNGLPHGASTPGDSSAARATFAPLPLPRSFSERASYQQRVNIRGEEIVLDPDGPHSDAAWAR
jgi:hypothetical protein